MKKTPKPLCAICEGRFSKISGETCKKCDRPFASLNEKFKKNGHCLDCIRWEEDRKWVGILEKNYSAVIYNDFAQEVIARYKYRGDYILADVLAYFIKEKLNTVEFDAICPIPLSENRLYERSFNQSEAIILACGHIPSKFLKRTHAEKQSKKSRSERIRLQQVFQTKGDIRARHILLIDDIYTTGSTLRHAAKVLKEAGVHSVSSLTFARG